MTFILVSMRIDKGEVYLVNSSLTWASHVDYLCAKLSSQIFALRQLKSCVDNSTLRTVYYSLIHNCFLCIMTYTVKECLRIAYVLGVHPMMNSKCQLMLHVTITIGAWLSMYLALSLLIYKEEKLTISDFTETFSGMSMLIHGAQRTASLYFNKSKIRQLLEISAKSFWSPNRIKLSPEVLEYTKRYHYRLKLAYRLFVVSCIFNTSGFCYQTFFFEEDILVIQCWKPEWMPFYPFWLFQGAQRTASLYFNKSKIRQLLEISAKSFWSPNRIKLSPEVLEYTKRYHYRLKLAYRLFVVSCIFNTSGFCYQTFFFEEDILVIQCWKPEWMPFYPFWLFQVLVMYFGVMLPIICLDTLIMTILADNLRNSAYNSKWYAYKREATSHIQLVICQGQKEVIITAGHLLDINLSTSLSMLFEVYIFNDQSVSSVAVNGLKGLNMPYYTIEKCLKMAWIVGAHPDMRHNKWQLSIFVILAIGNWLTIYLIVSLLFYKEDHITIGDFAETFSGMSLVIHGIQRSFSLFFNRKQISEMLQYVRSKFWKESDLDMTDEEKYICKKYYTRLKIAMYVFASSCTSNLFGFCCQTFFSDQDVLPLFRLLNHEVENLYSYGFQSGNRKYFMNKLRKIVRHHNFLLEFTQKINMTFSETFLTYMGIIIIAICIEMYNLSTGANMELFIRATLFTTATLFQFVAEKTFNSAYFSKWYENLNNAQPTKNIILQSQQKVFITAGRLIDINLATSLADLTEYLSGLVMPYYTIEKCLMMAWIVGAHPDMRNNKWQLSIFVILAIGNWLTIYLIVSLLFYKEDRITIGDFAETFSGMSLVIHGIQRSFSLFFNRKQISEMLQYVRSKFWKESDLDITDEEKYICKKYYTRLKIAMYVFASSCTSNLFGFCCQTFFSDQDILPLDCYKPDWLPFYPFWFLQVLVIFFGVNMAVICLDTLIMTLIVLTHIQFRLLNHEVENLYSYGFQNGNRKYFLNKLRKIVRHHKFLLDDLHRDVQLINRAEKTFNSAYFSKWYENLNNAQPTKNIILQSQQKTVKTMVSYCMFLRTMGVEQ
nr:unnamed protein product [Callosobruchus chinensis]